MYTWKPNNTQLKNYNFKIITSEIERNEINNQQNLSDTFFPETSIPTNFSLISLKEFLTKKEQKQNTTNTISSAFDLITEI